MVVSFGLAGKNLVKAFRTIILKKILVNDVTREVYHLEWWPSKGGHCVIVNSTRKTDLIDKDWNVNTHVHEYGRLAATVSAGDVYFSNFKNGCVYCTSKGFPMILNLSL